MITHRFHAGAAGGLAVLALAAIAAAPASAAGRPSAPTFSLSPVGAPGAVLLHGTPGRVLRGAVRVSNVSRHPITVMLSAADVQNASNGNADYVTTGVARAGRWLRLASSSVHLAPRAGHVVPFTVSVPAVTRGASHYAGIVASDAADLSRPTARTAVNGRTFAFRRINRQALPLTIRLPGPLTRSLVLSSVRLTVAPVGAGLVLGLLPGGTDLIQATRIQLRVMRDTRTVFTHDVTLGQLFPGATLDYQIPWVGRPSQGRYRVLGVMRPQGGAAVDIDTSVDFTPSDAARLTHAMPPATARASTSLPAWVWLALGLAVALVAGLSTAVWKLSRRTPQRVA